MRAASILFFGSSPAVFENSILHSRAPGYVTAASSADGQPGYVFINSTLTADPGLTAQVELGRPWRPNASVTYINSTIGDHIKPNGWNNWGNTANEATARYAEYLSKGLGANADKRYTWSKQLTATEAEQFTIQSTLAGADNWNPKDSVWLWADTAAPPKPGQGATGITVDKPSVQLEAGEAVQIQATVQPATVDQKVAWSGGNDKASVSSTGLISGLKPGTTKATVTSVTYSTYSTDVNVTVVDTKAPVWNAGSRLSVGSITSSGVTLSWPAATDFVGVSSYAIYVNGQLNNTVQGNMLSLPISGLNADTAYTFKVTARDGAGNESANGLSTVATTAKADVDPGTNPPKPGQGATGITVDKSIVQLEAGDSVQIQATVQPATVDQKVIWSGGNDKASVSSTGLISGLKPGTAKATVTSVTYSTYSTGVNVTVVDTKAPVWSSGTLSAGIVTHTSIALNWPAAKDYAGIAQYKLVWNNIEVVLDGNTQSYTVTELLPGAPYTFQLTAMDAAGNSSQPLSAAVRTYSSSSRGPSTGGASSGDGTGSGSTSMGGDNGATGASSNGQVKLPTDAMQVKNETNPDGTVSSKVTVDGAKLAEALKESANKKTTAVVLDLSSSSSVNVALPSQVLYQAAAASPNAVVIINTKSASYELPLQVISMLATANSKEGTLLVSISQANQQVQQLAAAQAKQAGGTLLQQPMEYRLSITVNGAAQEVLSSGLYIAHTMILSKAVDPNKVTGVIVDPVTGRMNFVPTLFVTENGVTKAKWMHPGNGVYAIIESSKAFEDMKDHWAQKEVELLASKWLIQGSSLNAFEPNRSITRAEFASILVRALGLQEQAAGTAFTDVKADTWYAGAVGTAAAAGLVQGFETGQFQPDATITREQMAVMVERAAKFAGMSTTESASLSQAYSDASSISGWAQTSVGWAVKAGIMQGTDERSFAPEELATRAQAAVMLMRMLQKLNFIN